MLVRKGEGMKRLKAHHDLVMASGIGKLLKNDIRTAVKKTAMSVKMDAKHHLQIDPKQLEKVDDSWNEAFDTYDMMFKGSKMEQGYVENWRALEDRPSYKVLVEDVKEFERSAKG